MPPLDTDLALVNVYSCAASGLACHKRNTGLRVWDNQSSYTVVYLGKYNSEKKEIMYRDWNTSPLKDPNPGACRANFASGGSRFTIFIPPPPPLPVLGCPDVFVIIGIYLPVLQTDIRPWLSTRPSDLSAIRMRLRWDEFRLAICHHLLVLSSFKAEARSLRDQWAFLMIFFWEVWNWMAHGFL